MSWRFYNVIVDDCLVRLHPLKTFTSCADVMIVMLLRYSVAAALLTIASVSSAGPAEPPSTGGCLCPTGAEQLLEQTDHVFIGDLVEIKDVGDEVGTAVIRVRENFKGELSGVVEVRDALATKCSWSVFEMASPGRYVIFANLDEGELVTPAFCPQTQPLSGWKDQLAPFRAYARAHRPAATGGHAVAAAPSKSAPAPKTGS